MMKRSRLSFLLLLGTLVQLVAEVQGGPIFKVGRRVLGGRFGIGGRFGSGRQGGGDLLISGLSNNSDLLFNPLLAKNQGPAYAACRIMPSTTLRAGEPAITGYAVFKQEGPKSQTEGYFKLQGFPASSSKHPMHVHELGFLCDGCVSTGGHYNPFGTSHPNHPGDFNNFEITGGTITKRLTGLKVTLFGINSILSRSVVLHNGVDDLGQGGDSGSLQHGNSGKPIACGVIRVSNAQFWNSIATM